MDLYTTLKTIVLEGGKDDIPSVRFKRLKQKINHEEKKKYLPKKNESNEQNLESIRQSYKNYWKEIERERIKEKKQYFEKNKERSKELELL